METERKFKELEEKYWSGETTLIEDSALLKAVKEHPEYFSDELRSVFKARLASENQKLDENFETEFWAKVDNQSGVKTFSFAHFMRYAAVGIIVLGVGYFSTKLIQLKQPAPKAEVVSHTSLEDTYESPELAFEEAKKALMMASGKLNEGQNKLSEIKRFHHAKVTVMGAVEK